MDEFVLAVDLDGVCAKYNEAFRSVVAQERNVPEESLPLVTRWGFGDWDLHEEEYERLHDIAVREYRMFLNAAVVDNCADVLWRLSDAGAWIRIITHRLYTLWGHETAVVDTAQWLDAANIPYRDLCFLGEKSDVDADVFIEDSPINIERLRAKGLQVIVYDHGYNRHFEGPRAHSWLEVEQQVMEMLTAHQGAVEATLPGVSDASTRLSARKSGLR